jgi:OOP family OmpA-OmpF porin
MMTRMLTMLVAATLLPGGAAAAEPESRQVAGISGATGVVRVLSAETPEPLHVSTGLSLQFLKSDDLIRTGDENGRVITDLAFGIVPTEHVEISALLRSSANHNSGGTPELVQSLGDLSLGLKVGYPALPFLSVGGALGLDLLNGEGRLLWDGDATSVHIKALATLDARALNPEAIVRAHLNIGYSFENGDALLGERESLLPEEQFAWNAKQFDTVDLALAIEVLPEAVTPFIEWGLSIPVSFRNDTGDVCLDEEQLCPSEEGFAALPHRLTVGVMGEALPGMLLRAAVDIGLTREISQGIPAMPVWNAIVGLSYNIGQGGGPPQVIVREVQVEGTGGPAPGGRIRGRVVDATTREPINGARVRYPRENRTDQVTPPNGIFTSYAFDPGAIRVEVSSPGYVKGAFQIPVTDRTVDFSFPLQPSGAGAAAPVAPTPSAGGASPPPPPSGGDPAPPPATPPDPLAP